jgi:uncharacterized protein (DUF362 family)
MEYKVESKLTRRGFLWTAAGAAAASRFVFGRQAPSLVAPASQADNLRSVVSLVHGESRRKNVYEALAAIEDQILPKLRQKKYAVIKPNIVNTVNQLAATHVDALNGILDFLAPRFKGPVVIAESAAGNTFDGYENFKYQSAAQEHKGQNVSLLDLNEEGKYQTIPLLNADIHIVQGRLAARLLDPDAYIICSALLKTHNVTVATLSVKNMALGAPLHSTRRDSRRWNDKRIYHGGVRQTHVDILLTAQKLQPYWGATVIDGFEGMEGNGPNSGLPVASKIAIASTDYIAADRVGVETMGINPDWLGYLNFCAQSGLGQYDLSKIDLRGAKIADVARKYQLHPDIERELQWMGPMTEIPPRLG